MNARSGNWQPDMNKIGTIIRLIEYIQSTDNAKQKEAFEKFHELKKNEEFAAYCAAIFSRTTLSIDVRRQSGLLLKEALRHSFRKQNQQGFDGAEQNDEIISDAVLSVCKECLLQCLCEDGETSKFIRDTSAIAVTTIARELHMPNEFSGGYREFEEWPDLVPSLLTLLQKHHNDTNPIVLQSILNCINLLCHDCSKLMGNSESSRTLVEALLGFASSSNHDKIRHLCLQSLYYLFHYQPPALLSKMADYIQLVRSSTSLNNTHIMKTVTDSIVVLMNEHWDTLSSNNNPSAIRKIFDFMLLGTRHSDSDVCCTAAEFWALYALDKSKPNEPLISFFPILLPVLIRRCRYTDELLTLIDFDNDHQSKADLSEDVAPVFYTSRAERNDETNNKDASNQYTMDEEESSWNIRKCCASQLEKLSFCGGPVKEKLLSIVLPIIKQALDSKEQLDREAGLLVLGAITQKEYESIIPALPELIPFIIRQCNTEKNILVQQIAYWSLARFSNWYSTSKEGKTLYDRILFQLLKGMRSNSKRVQRAACGAIATFVTNTNESIMTKKEYIEALMTTFLEAFKIYHLKNFPHLIDVILCCTRVIAKNTTGTVGTENGSKNHNTLCDAAFQDALLPPIIKRWIALQNDVNIFPLFEAITQWTSFVGHTPHFQQLYLKQIFVTTLNMTVELKNACREYEEYVKEMGEASGDDDDGPEKPDKEFWVCSLDLLAVLVEKCNPAVSELIWRVQSDFGGYHCHKLLEMLHVSIYETHFNVRRNGLALLGDLVTQNPAEMKSHMDVFMEVVLRNLNWDWQTVCTNASWVVGQSLREYKGEPVMDKYCDEILSRLVDILKCKSAPQYIVTNAAITMARLVKSFPDRIIKKWDNFAVEWIQSLAGFQEDDDKIDAFATLMMVVMKQPVVVVQSRHGCKVLFESIAAWEQPPQFLNEMFQKVLAGFKVAAPSWEQIMRKLEPNSRQILQTRYHV